MFTILYAIELARFHLSCTIVSEDMKTLGSSISLFVDVFHSSAGLHSAGQLND